MKTKSKGAVQKWHHFSAGMGVSRKVTKSDGKKGEVRAILTTNSDLGLQVCIVRGGGS